jgi:hypothetical protein
MEQIKLHALNIVKLELFDLQAKPLLFLFPSGKQT